MITLLTSELNETNKGCDKYQFVQDINCGGILNGKIFLCPKCEGRKETLKKVSLMWADEMLDIFDYDEPIRDELLQIKSLMEKA